MNGYENKFCYLSLFLFCSMSIPTSWALFKCPIVMNQENNKTATIEILFDWCVNEPKCSHNYHQIAGKTNFTVFRHLVQPQLAEDFDIIGWAGKLLCENTEKEIIKELSLLRLSANREMAHPTCDIMHRLIFDAKSMKFECTCDPNTQCSDDLFDQTLYRLLLIVILIAAIAFLIKTIYQIITISKISDNVGIKAFLRIIK